MRIIADCGSTKIDWVVLSDKNKVTIRVTTRGYNALSRIEKELTDIIESEAAVLKEISDRVIQVSFFGAGCGTEATCERVREELISIFPEANCLVGSDMLAAAIALCGNEPGIACILGTGSNSCLFDGQKIIANVSPLGFILGDEGSGAVLGCKLLGGVFKRQFSIKVIERFNAKYQGLKPNDIIEEVYRGVQPRAYLASFAPFLSENIDLKEIDDFVVEEFCRFFKRNIQVYSLEANTAPEMHSTYEMRMTPERNSVIEVENLPVHFTGSIALNFQSQLQRAAQQSGRILGRILKSPMEALIQGEKI